MSDIPLEGREIKEERPLTQEEINALDIRELQRGINVQAALLESIVLAFDHVLKRYIELTQVNPVPKEKPSEEKTKPE
jgi:hypothetical protein